MANYRILCFGDSITQGALDTEGGWVDRLKRSLTDRELQGVDGNRYQVYNLGIGGDTSEGLKRRLESEIEPRISESWQNIIAIAIGINDSRFNGDLKRIEVSPEDYESNLKEIVKIATKFSEKVCLIGITPVAASGVKDKIVFKNLTYANGYKSEGIEEYDNILSRVAKKLAIPKLNVFTEAKNDPVFMDSLHLDLLHPDNTGHAWLHEKVEKFILSLLEE